MLKEIALPQASRVTPTGLYLISTAFEGKRNVQFAFRALGLTDDLVLSHFFRQERAARIYDGPDEVHKLSVGAKILKQFAPK